MRRVLDPKTASYSAFILFPFLKNGEQVNAGSLPAERRRGRGARPAHVVIRLAHPWPLLPLYASRPGLWPEPATSRRALGRRLDASPATTSATGPTRWSAGGSATRSCCARTRATGTRTSVCFDEVDFYPVDRRDLQRAQRPRRRARHHRPPCSPTALALLRRTGMSGLPAGRAAVRRHLPGVQYARPGAEGRAGPPGALDGDRPRLHHPQAAARAARRRPTASSDRLPDYSDGARAYWAGLAVRAPAGRGAAAAGGGRLRARPSA